MLLSLTGYYRGIMLKEKGPINPTKAKRVNGIL
jgi:hypothetical protein